MSLVAVEYDNPPPSPPKSPLSVESRERRRKNRRRNRRKAAALKQALYEEAHPEVAWPAKERKRRRKRGPSPDPPRRAEVPAQSSKSDRKSDRKRAKKDVGAPSPDPPRRAEVLAQSSKSGGKRDRKMAKIDESEGPDPPRHLNVPAPPANDRKFGRKRTKYYKGEGSSSNGGISPADVRVKLHQFMAGDKKGNSEDEGNPGVEVDLSFAKFIPVKNSAEIDAVHRLKTRFGLGGARVSINSGLRNFQSLWNLADRRGLNPERG